MQSMVSLIPKDEKFYEMFNGIAENIHAGALLLSEMFQNLAKSAEYAGKIKDVEHKGDAMTHNLITKLNQTFITPFDREDIHSLTSKLDDVLDLIDAVASRFGIFKLTNVTPHASHLMDLVCQSTKELVKAVRALKVHNSVLEHCVEVNRLEHVTDEIFREALANLFENEKDPIALIKYKEVYEALEQATDRCEDVANILEAIVVKNA
jgi:predicted phosphate transport protein (TIGR00153 family)